ncbi:ATP-binding protein [Streptomyces pactum]|uniref:ATP-binding protein n=1 Tax=Streptomyces pactum TaxID=68249 RepID=UPI0037015B59
MVAGDLVTVNPVDGSEIEPCPPGKRPAAPVRYGPGRRDELRRAAATPVPAPPAEVSLVPERAEVRERLATLLTRGRSIRLTGPAGSGRTTVLAAVAADCARLAPDGVIRLSGRHRTPTDLLHDLHAAVFDAPRHRLDRAELLAAVREIGAVVVLDDIEFGGAALEDFLDATPECAFLISATPHTPVPSADSHLEEVALAGLSRAACQELLEHHLGGPLDAEEADWATRLWSRSEGLPLRCVQAAALLADRRAGADGAPLPDPAEAAAPGALLAAGLDETGRDVLRLAVALGGECPHPVHLAALTGDERTEDILAELAGRGLVTPAGPRHRLAAGVADELTAAGYAEGAAARAEAVAGHYAWWAGHPEVTPEQVAREADVIVATLSALVTGRDAAAAAAAVPLARAAAPALAAGLAWSAWERALRHGAEAARLAGEVAEEAYFHHDLGILALCTGNLGRARAELEASIGLRGALADRRGAVSGRRALALVADRSGTPAPALPADRPAASEAPAPAPDAAAAGPDRPGPGAPAGPAAAAFRPAGPAAAAPTGRDDEDIRGTAVTEQLSVIAPADPAPAGSPFADPAPTAELPGVTGITPLTRPAPAAPGTGVPGAAAGASFDSTFASSLGSSASGGPASGGGFGTGFGAGAAPGAGTGAFPAPAAGAGASRKRGLARLALHGTRRNIAAAGAGALLVAVLGTVVTLGMTSGEDEEPARNVRPEKSTGRTAEPDDDPTTRTPSAGPTGTPRTGTGTPTAPPATGPATGTTTPEQPTAPASTGQPTTPATTPPTSATTPPPTSPQPPTSPTTRPTTNPTPPATTNPTPPATTPPGGGSSNTASGPAPSGGSATEGAA